MTMPLGSVEEYDEEINPAQFTIPTMPVHVVSSDAAPGRQIAAEHGYWRTYLISPNLNAQSATPGAVRIANRSLRRRRLLIAVNGVISNSNATSSQELTPANPAAGADFIYTNSTAFAQTVLSVRFTFTADAVVANRFLSVQWKDSAGNIIAQVSNGSAVVASTSTQVNLYQGASNAWSAASGAATGGIPTSVAIPPGGTFTIHTSGIDPGDQLSAIVLVLAVASQATTDGVVVGNAGVICSGQPMTPLQGIGAGYIQTGQSLRWECQQELWAAYPASNVGNVVISVCDEAYASDPKDHEHKEEVGENT